MKHKYHQQYINQLNGWVEECEALGDVDSLAFFSGKLIDYVSKTQGAGVTDNPSMGKRATDVIKAPYEPKKPAQSTILEGKTK
jgi:hypothetical protein